MGEHICCDMLRLLCKKTCVACAGCSTSSNAPELGHLAVQRRLPALEARPRAAARARLLAAHAKPAAAALLSTETAKVLA